MKLIDVIIEIAKGKIDNFNNFIVNGDMYNAEDLLEYYGLKDDCIDFESLVENLNEIVYPTKGGDS